VGTAHQLPPVASTTIARPPFLLLGFLFLGHALDHLVPIGTGFADNHWLRHSQSVGLILAGLAVFLAGVRNFTRAGTPVPSNQPVRTLVTTGIHGWSRNPIYLGMLIFYLGIGVLLRGAWIMLMFLPLAATLRYIVIAREEAYLERRFGEAYRDYRARVRRWL
jgi:protein-S-isoprenylcysteine O-methyltransferase Ste14